MKYFAIFCCAWYLWVPVTFWFGRVFCRFCCPLGLSQSLVSLIVRPKTRVRRVCTELPRSALQRVVNWTIVAAYFLTPIGVYVNPWGVFGRVLTLFVPGIVFFAAILVLALFGKGRIWCNWVCPFGTIFDLVARLGWHRDSPCRSCANCRACFGPAGRARESGAANADGVTRREALKGVAAVAAVETLEKTTDGGYAPVSLPGVPARTIPALPPGAADVASFRTRCVGCGLCIKACPEGVLKPSVALASFGQPVMVFQESFCRPACSYRCGSVCPTGAIRDLTGIPRKDVHRGVARWSKDLCIRTTRNESCTACVRKCPVKAIHLEGGFPVVDADACIGCGACEHVCPSRPLPAIAVEGLERARIVRRMAESDLVAEMVSRIQAGESVLVASNGVITASETGRGVAPLLGLLDRGALKGALVVDKVIGRAAAAIAIVGEAKKVVGLVMAEDARRLLQSHGVETEAIESAAGILNRDRSGRCPLEATVDALEDPVQMVEALRAFKP